MELANNIQRLKLKSNLHDDVFQHNSRSIPEEFKLRKNYSLSLLPKRSINDPRRKEKVENSASNSFPDNAIQHSDVRNDRLGESLLIQNDVSLLAELTFLQQQQQSRTSLLFDNLQHTDTYDMVSRRQNNDKDVAEIVRQGQRQQTIRRDEDQNQNNLMARNHSLLQQLAAENKCRSRNLTNSQIFQETTAVDETYHPLSRLRPNDGSIHQQQNPVVETIDDLARNGELTRRRIISNLQQLQYQRVEDLFSSIQSSETTRLSSLWNLSSSSSHIGVSDANVGFNTIFPSSTENSIIPSGTILNQANSDFPNNSLVSNQLRYYAQGRISSSRLWQNRDTLRALNIYSASESNLSELYLNNVNWSQRHWSDSALSSFRISEQFHQLQIQQNHLREQEQAQFEQVLEHHQHLERQISSLQTRHQLFSLAFILPLSDQGICDHRVGHSRTPINDTQDDVINHE
jgi:hypothetical protein